MDCPNGSAPGSIKLHLAALLKRLCCYTNGCQPHVLGSRYVAWKVFKILVLVNHLDA